MKKTGRKMRRGIEGAWTLVVVAVFLGALPVVSIAGAVEVPTSDEVALNLTSGIETSLTDQNVVDFLSDLDGVYVKLNSSNMWPGKGKINWLAANKSLIVFIDVKTLAIEYIIENKMGNETELSLMPIPLPEPELEPEPTPTITEKSWHLVTTFDSGGDWLTPPFPIKGNMWRIHYVVHPEKGRDVDSDFHIDVYNPGYFGHGSSHYGSWYCTGGSCRDTLYVYKGYKDFVIEVKSHHNYWEVEVEDYY